MDALDFNLILSPEDEWTGFITSDEATGVITFNTNDNSCTAPNFDGSFEMPFIYRPGADTGYIEVIGMGSPQFEVTDGEVALGGIAWGAKHGADGIPKDCTAVASNFFAGGIVGSTAGNVDFNTTVQANTDAALLLADPTLAIVTNDLYEETDNVLKVSYFIRDGASGVEFGNNAVHIVDFMNQASMTNQQLGVFSGDLSGFDFPDLNGPTPGTGLGPFAPRTNYEALRSAIGGNAIINDWSANQNEAGFTVGTDWVVTVPGQYAMLDLFVYLGTILDPDLDCLGTVAAAAASAVPNALPVFGCDYRDIPLTASFSVWDREEQSIVGPAGELVVSPSLPGTPNVTLLDKEVNVIEWGVAPVLDAPSSITVSTPADSVNGWARLTVSPWAGTVQAVCDFAIVDPTSLLLVATTCSGPGDGTPVAAGQIPMVGFVAWERSFAANPDANYGRIVEHSYTSSS